MIVAVYCTGYRPRRVKYNGIKESHDPHILCDALVIFMFQVFLSQTP